MAHTLSITDGTTTVTLSSGNQYLSRYTPETAWNNEDVSERVMVGFTGATITDALTTLRTISTLFEQARRWDKYKTGPRVFINFDPGATGTAYRSLLRGGNLNLNEKTLKEHWGGRNLELELEWTRQGFWEGPETALSMTSFATALNTTVSIMNKSDSDGGNYVTIASTDIVLGDMPAPMKLTVTNTSPTTDGFADITDLYVFHNADSGPSTFAHVIEGESSTDITGTGTTDTTSSNYAYAALSWVGTTDTFLARYTVSNIQVDAMAGGRFALIAAQSVSVSSSADTKYLSVRLITTSFDAWYYTGQKTQISNDGNNYYTFIDVLRVPPSLQTETTFDTLYLELWGYAPSTDTHTYPLDYLMLAPISADNGWLRVKFTGAAVSYGVVYNEKIVVNEYDGSTYILSSGNLKKAVVSLYGGPILLIPNKTQRLYFLANVPSGNIRTQAMTVSISYRPRYRAL